MKNNKRGFVFIVLLIVAILLGAIGFTGWYVWNKSDSNNEDPTFLVEINTMVGGGITGAVKKYEITADGEIYSIKSTDYKTEAKKTLIKTISVSQVNDLRQSFIDSGVLELSPVDGPKYSSTTWGVTISGREHVFYDQSSIKFNTPKIKLKSILGDNIIP